MSSSEPTTTTTSDNSSSSSNNCSAEKSRIFQSEEEIKTNYWFIIDGMVIDFSDFLWGHPGGPSFLKEWNGKDATQKFKYFGHSERAWEMVREMSIGRLEKKE